MLLSPVKAPAAYGKFDAFLATLGSTTFTIAGTYFGSTSQAYNYSGAVGPTHITLTSAGGNHVIKVPLASLQYNATNLIDDNGIYTCNAPYTVDGVAHHVADNDLYAAVYRDLVAGFNLGFDARYVWMRQKRIQGSHFAHQKQAAAANRLVIERRIDPCTSEVFAWDEIPRAHDLMWKNEHAPGNMAVLVGAPRRGLCSLADVLAAR